MGSRLIILNRTFGTILGWAVFGYVAYTVSGAPGGSSVYNPFEILGLSEVHHFMRFRLFMKLMLNFITER
jgi:preprotein translocase subunit Sec63